MTGLEAARAIDSSAAEFNGAVEVHAPGQLICDATFGGKNFPNLLSTPQAGINQAIHGVGPVPHGQPRPWAAVKGRARSLDGLLRLWFAANRSLADDFLGGGIDDFVVFAVYGTYPP